jgi:hypothetical protein
MCKVVTEGHILTLSYHLFTDAAAARAAEVAQARAAPLLENVRELAACSKRHSKVLEAEYLAVPDLPPLCLPSLDGARGSGVYGALKALVDDPHFLPDGGALSFLAQHAYPVTAIRQRRRCGALLRGGDLLLAAAARWGWASAWTCFSRRKSTTSAALTRPSCAWHPPRVPWLRRSPH